MMVDGDRVPEFLDEIDQEYAARLREDATKTGIKHRFSRMLGIVKVRLLYRRKDRKARVREEYRWKRGSVAAREGRLKKEMGQRLTV